MSRNKMTGRIFIHLFFAGIFFAAAESVAASGAKASLSVNISKTRNRESEHSTAQKGNASVTTMIEKETETCTLDIEVENLAEQTGNYDVQWCVIAKRTSGADDEKLVVSDSGKIEITRGSKMAGTETVNPKPFIFTVTSIDRTGNSSGGSSSNARNSTQTREGDVYAGYIVLVKAGGEILAQDSNDDRFLKEEWIAQCEKAVQLKASLKAKQKKKK